jgi:hypothetical protein
MHMKKIGKDLFGCGFPPYLLQRCSNAFPPTGDWERLVDGMPVAPRGVCMNHAYRPARVE